MVMSLGHCHPRLVDVVQRQVAELSFTYRFSFRNGPMLELAEELRERLAARGHLVLLQLVGLRVGGVGDPARPPLLAAARQAREDRPDLALALVPRLDARRALALGLASGAAFYEPILDKHPVAPVPNADIRRRRAAGRGGRLGRARARGRDRCAAAPQHRRGRRDRARHGRVGGRDRAAGRLHRRAPAQSATGTTSCSSSTRRSRPSGARGSGSPPCHWPEATPDIITFAKGVTSGIVPFSGVLVSGARRGLFERSADGFPYGHTFSGYPLGCAVAAEAIRVIRDEDLVAESRRKGALLRARLDALAAGSPRIGDVRGLGLLQGLELVPDRETLAPPPGAASRLVGRVPRARADDLRLPDAAGRDDDRGGHARAAAHDHRRRARRGRRDPRRGARRDA